MFAIKMIVNNFAAWRCCSHYIVARIVISFKIMTDHCFLKGFKTEEKGCLKYTLL